MAAIGVGTMALNFLSVISGGLGILQFGMDNFKEPEEVGSVLTVQVALDYKTDHSSLSNAGGEYVNLSPDMSSLEYLEISYI